MHDAAQATHDAIETVWRLEAAKVIGAVARLTHDVGVAEELAGDALVAAPPPPSIARSTGCDIARWPPPSGRRWCATLYEALLAVQPSPVAALPLVQALTAEPQFANDHLLPSVHADLLARLGRHDEARAMWQRAADLTRNARERELLLARANTPRGEKQ